MFLNFLFDLHKIVKMKIQNLRVKNAKVSSEFNIFQTHLEDQEYLCKNRLQSKEGFYQKKEKLCPFRFYEQNITIYFTYSLAIDISVSMYFLTILFL